MTPTKQGNANATSVDQTFNMFGVLLNFLVTPNETGHEISLFKGTLPPGSRVVSFQVLGFWSSTLSTRDALPEYTF